MVVLVLFPFILYRVLHHLILQLINILFITIILQIILTIFPFIDLLNLVVKVYSLLLLLLVLLVHLVQVLIQLFRCDDGGKTGSRQVTLREQDVIIRNLVIIIYTISS